MELFDRHPKARGAIYTFVYTVISVSAASLANLGGVALVASAAVIATLLGAAYRGPGQTRR